MMAMVFGTPKTLFKNCLRAMAMTQKRSFAAVPKRSVIYLGGD